MLGAQGFLILFAVHLGIVVGVENLGGKRKLVFDQRGILVEIPVGQRVYTLAERDLAVYAVVEYLVGDKTAVGKHGNMLTLGENVGAH